MAEAAKPVQQIDPVVAQDLARLALSLSHNKEHRKDFGNLVRKAMPDSPHAAAFADVEIEDKFEAFERREQEKEIKRQQEAVLQRMNNQRAALLTGGEDGSGRKYSEDDLKKIDALMEKKGIVDYDDGATLYAASNPPENTKPSKMPIAQGTTWELPEFAKFGKDPTKASREVAQEVIGEFMRKRA